MMVPFAGSPRRRTRITSFRRPSSRTTVMGRLLLCSVLAGLVLAALALPVVGGAGYAVRAAADAFQDLPSQLLTPPPPQRTRVLAVGGALIATFYSQDRVDVPLNRIAGTARRAIVAIEDSRFYQHGGVDLHGIARAAIADLSSGAPVQGASTLTQQYVKNVLIETARTPAERAAARADTLNRKLQEARYAIALEKRLTKDQILDRYLNIVYFGGGAYGIEAAARRYFGEHASQLTLAQAALLAGLVRDPSAYDPIEHPAAARARRDVVLARMAQLGDITPAAARTAQRTPVALHPHPMPGVGCSASLTPFFCSDVEQQLLADPALGATVAQRRERLYTGGLTIQTTLEPHVQAAAAQAVRRDVPPGGPVAAAADVVQPGTGHIEAMAVDRAYGTDAGQTTVNLATGGATGYQAGSTFKIFTLATALEQGIPLSTTIYSPPRITVSGFQSCSGATFPPYPVTNAGANEGGDYTLRRATWESVNTYFVQLELRTGICAPARLAGQLGVRHVDGSPLDVVPSFTLGSNDVSPLAMAGAYAAFAAGGRYCPPTAVTAVTDARGQQLATGAGGCRQVVPAAIAAQVTDVLSGVIDGPDPARTGAGASIGVPAAGKTGTTDGFSAAWFDGYTSRLAAAVWVGDPAGGDAHPLRNVTLDGRYFPVVYGGDIPATIWHDTMSGALAAGGP